MTMPSTNPFEVLRLSPSATDGDVVRQAGRLRQRAPDEGTLTAIRQAVQALTGSAEERCLHQHLTHPLPCYHWPALERFTTAFRRPPAADLAELDFTEVVMLLRMGGGEVSADLEQEAVKALRQCLHFLSEPGA